MYRDRKLVSAYCFVVVAVVALCLCGCGEKIPTIEKTKDTGRLAGTWVLKTRLVGGEDDGKGVPASERQMKLVFTDDQLFRAEFRGDASQKWISGGRGSFSYSPPLLTMYWESGTINPLLVVEQNPDTIVLHHCRTMIPVRGQEPSEIFVRQKGGPTRKAS